MVSQEIFTVNGQTKQNFPIFLYTLPYPAVFITFAPSPRGIADEMAPPKPSPLRGRCPSAHTGADEVEKVAISPELSANRQSYPPTSSVSLRSTASPPGEAFRREQAPALRYPRWFRRRRGRRLGGPKKHQICRHFSGTPRTPSPTIRIGSIRVGNGPCRSGAFGMHKCIPYGRASKSVRRAGGLLPPYDIPDGSAVVGAAAPAARKSIKFAGIFPGRRGAASPTIRIGSIRIGNGPCRSGAFGMHKCIPYGRASKSVRRI